MRRYAKETRILSELKKVPAAVLDYGRLVEQNLAAILLGNVVAPAFPKLPAVNSGRPTKRLRAA